MVEPYFKEKRWVLVKYKKRNDKIKCNVGTEDSFFVTGVLSSV